MIAHYAHGVYSHYAQSVLKYMYTMHNVFDSTLSLKKELLKINSSFFVNLNRYNSPNDS